MTICSDRIQKLVMQLDGDVLAAAGFTLTGRTWNKPNAAGFTYVVDVQGSQHDGGTNCRATVNLGVYVPLINRFVARVAQREYIMEHECDFRERLGVLTHGQDEWWPLDDNVKRVSARIAPLLTQQAMPWFDQFADVERIIRTWEYQFVRGQTNRQFDLSVATLFARLGLKNRARDVLHQLVRTAQAEDKQAYFADQAESEDISTLMKSLDLLA